MDKPTTDRSWVTHLEVTHNEDNSIDVSVTGAPFDIVYCCTYAIVGLAAELGRQPRDLLRPMPLFADVIEVVNSKTSGETKIDMGPIKAAMERLRDKYDPADD